VAQYKRKDYLYDQAKASGVRSRAYFKLEELSRKQKILSSGRRVVDLGAWPGGWSEYAAKVVGPRGRVVGIDLKKVEPLNLAQVSFICGDVGDPDALAAVQAELGGNADVILSDMSPKLSGIRECDDAGIATCLRAVLMAASILLKPGGLAIAKAFPGNETEACVREFKDLFSRVSRVKLDSTRKSSNEFYILARDFKADSNVKEISVDRDPKGTTSDYQEVEE
jgi:23S rRNA (uridine2552-2'-O)-methyltransferase